MNFIDITGAGNAGKGALVDLLREFDNFYCPEWYFEFDMMRVPGGLLDFRRCLTEDWSPIKSHAAYHAFLDVTDKMGRDPKFFDLRGFLKSTPQRYDKKFGGSFRELSREFANKFVVASYKSEWPYDALRENNCKRATKRIARRLGLRRSLFDNILLIDGKDFDRLAKLYIEDLYKTFIPKSCKNIVMNNAFDPYNPRPGLDMLNAKQIVISRDPRDVYISGLSSDDLNKEDKKLLGPENDGLSKLFLATDDLDIFIKRFRLMNDKVCNEKRDDVLNISFESLILEYESQLPKILDFLDLDTANHINQFAFLKPSESKKNISLWKKSSKISEIRYIESQLGEYLYN